MFSVSKQQILGALKATGSKDPDVLFAAKEGAVAQIKPLRTMSLIPIICGVLLSLTLIGAFVGIPFALFGAWLRWKVGKSLKLADETYREHLTAIGAAPRAAAPVPA